MKVLVISDTHGQLYRAQMVIDYCRERQINTVIHCGDHINDAKELSKSNADITMYAVPGNCDWMSSGVDKDLFVELEGVNCLITHGDRHHVKYDYEELYIDGQAHEANIVIFGHTHSAHKEEKNGIKILNPGSITQPRDTPYPSFSIVDIQNKRVVDVSIFQVQGAKSIVPHPYY